MTLFLMKCYVRILKNMMVLSKPRRGGGELVFKTKQTLKTRVPKTYFVWIVSQNFS